MEFINFKNFISVKVYFTVVAIAMSTQVSPHSIETKRIENNGIVLDFSLTSENKSGSQGQGQEHKYSNTKLTLSADNNLEQFQTQIEHVQNSGFQNWREKEMQEKRNSSKSVQKGNISSNSNRRGRRRRHVNLNTSFSYSLRFPTSITHIDLVVIGTRTDVLEAFKGKLMQYGTNNQALLWSSRRFHTFVLQKSGKRNVIFECGEMYIAGRLLNGYTTYVHDFYPTQVRNPLGGNLRFPINQRCNKMS